MIAARFYARDEDLAVVLDHAHATAGVIESAYAVMPDGHVVLRFTMATPNSRMILASHPKLIPLPHASMGAIGVPTATLFSHIDVNEKTSARELYTMLDAHSPGAAILHPDV